MMNRNEWVQALKVGDKVMYTAGGVGAMAEVAEVERLTKTLIIIKGCSTRFRRETGSSVGTSWYNGYINKYSKEAEVEAQALKHRKKLLNRVRNISPRKWGVLSDEQLVQILKVVDK